MVSETRAGPLPWHPWALLGILVEQGIPNRQARELAGKTHLGVNPIALKADP